jgi:hypothetical protein
MTNSLANPAEETVWLDGLLAQTNIADVLCEALTRALEGADKTAINHAIGAIAARTVLLGKKEAEWAFWQNLLEMMTANDHVPPPAKTAARRALHEQPSRNAMTFLAKCIGEHLSNCNNLMAEGVTTPGDTVARAT